MIVDEVETCAASLELGDDVGSGRGVCSRDELGLGEELKDVAGSGSEDSVGGGTGAGILAVLIAAVLDSVTRVCDVIISEIDDVASMVELKVRLSEVETVAISVELCEVSAAEVEDSVSCEETTISDVVGVGCWTISDILDGSATTPEDAEL